MLPSRHFQADIDWDISCILEGHRLGFGLKGPKELAAEQLIVKSAEGDYHRVYTILKDSLAHPDIADVHGYTALAAAAVRLQILLHILFCLKAKWFEFNFLLPTCGNMSLFKTE